MNRNENSGAGKRVSMKRASAPLKFPFDYCDTPELRVLDLSADGIQCVPVLGYTRIEKGGRQTTTEEHTHEECIEISYCQRGELVFESNGLDYPFKPGNVFVSRPDERHRLKTYPKGLLMYWLLFRIPKKGFQILNLPKRESDWLRGEMISMPQRLFHGGDRVRQAFQRVLMMYDREPGGTPQRHFRLRMAVCDLLLSVLDASHGGDVATGDERVEKLIAEIRNDPVKDFSIDELSEKAALSPSNLIVRFKRLAGLPPQAFRNACRIAAAKRELERGRKTVTAIALSLGYSSSQNFATQFRLATGKTPKEWRKMP